jgi:hypothetical protein
VASRIKTLKDPQPPIYRNITVRDALNMMALRSPHDKAPISGKYRFRHSPDGKTGLGGYPIFQTF